MDELHNLPLSRPRKPAKSFRSALYKIFSAKKFGSTQNKILGPPFLISLPKVHIEIHPKIFEFLISSPKLSSLTDIFVIQEKLSVPMSTFRQLPSTWTIPGLYLSYVILNSQACDMLHVLSPRI